MPKKIKTTAVNAAAPKYVGRTCDYCRNPIERQEDHVVVLARSFNGGKMIERKRHGHRKCVSA